MLVHGDLKVALWSVLPVKGRRMVVEIHHPDRHSGNVVVQLLILSAYLRRLGLKRLNAFSSNSSRLHL